MGICRLAHIQEYWLSFVLLYQSPSKQKRPPTGLLFSLEANNSPRNRLGRDRARGGSRSGYQNRSV